MATGDRFCHWYRKTASAPEKGVNNLQIILSNELQTTPVTPQVWGTKFATERVDGRCSCKITYLFSLYLGVPSAHDFCQTNPLVLPRAQLMPEDHQTKRQAKPDYENSTKSFFFPFTNENPISYPHSAGPLGTGKG